MRIILDAMGGDNAPHEVVKGAVMAAREYGEQIILVGDETEVNKCLTSENADGLDIVVVHAEDKVTMEDNPSTVLREKPNSSMAIAFNMLKRGEGDAVVSAGNTGALLVGATLIVKRIKGIRRAALVAQIPNKKSTSLLVDCGANVDCTPEQLLQFAAMGSFYMEHVEKRENPKVALMNNGTEEEKGGELQLLAYGLLKNAHKNKVINFIGNIEGRDIVSGTCDVVVCDGFTGNVMLKSVEGVATMIMSMLKEAFLSSGRGKIAALLLKPALLGLRSKMDHSQTGGAPLLGISKPVIKAHGSSKAESFKNAVKQAIEFTNANIIEKIEQNMELMTAETKE